MRSSTRHSGAPPTSAARAPHGTSPFPVTRVSQSRSAEDLSRATGSPSATRAARHPLRLSPVPVPQRPRPPARALPVVDPQDRSQDRHPHAQPRTARAVPPPVRQHQAPSRADQPAPDALSRSRRARRRMDTTMRRQLFPPGQCWPVLVASCDPAATSGPRTQQRSSWTSHQSRAVLGYDGTSR